GPAVEGSDHEPLHHHAKQHDEQGTGDDGEGERAAVGIGDPTGVAAEHEHRAVRQIEDAERAVDDRQAGRDQREERAEYQAVEALRYKVGPVDHIVARVGEDRPNVMADFDPVGHLLRHSWADTTRTERTLSAALRRRKPALSGIVAELAAEGVRLLHEWLA